MGIVSDRISDSVFLTIVLAFNEYCLQMGLLEGSHNRKRVHQHAGLGPGLRDIVPRDPQRRALEVAGKPYHMVKQARGSSDGPVSLMSFVCMQGSS